MTSMIVGFFLAILGEWVMCADGSIRDENGDWELLTEICVKEEEERGGSSGVMWRF
jgi:hypothetical protein